MKPAFIRQIPSNAAHEYVVLARCCAGHGVAVISWLVFHHHTGKGLQLVPHILQLKRLLKLEVNAFAVPAHHRHANRCAGHVHLLIAQDFLGFIPHLHLLPRIPVVSENIAMGQAIQINGVRIDGRVNGLAGAFRFQLHDGGFAGSGDALVRAHNAALDTVGVVQRLEGHQELHRRAIGVGDYAVVGTDGVAVHLGYHEWACWIHAPRTAVVDDRGPHFGKLGRPLFGHIPASTEQRHLRPCRQHLLNGLYGPFPALELHLIPSTAFTSCREQLIHRQCQLFHHFEHGPPDESRGSNYRQFQSIHGS